jgi:cytochrome c553
MGTEHCDFIACDLQTRWEEKSEAKAFWQQRRCQERGPMGGVTETCTERVTWQRSAQILVLSVLVSATGAMVVAYHAPGAAAQTAAPKPDELRTLYVTPLEIAEGKRVAEASCAGCHGVDGISTIPSVPHLAGQRPAYLFLELKAYQSGVRGERAMQGAVKKYLNDDALINVSAYYASLDPAQPGSTAPAAAIDPVEIGKAAAASCAGCHGEHGVSKIPGMPNLVGLDPKYLVTAMKEYQSGQRKDDMMKSLLTAVSDADLNNLALYYALQKAERAQTPSLGDPTKGKAAATTCVGCHGQQDSGGSAVNPSLAGQDAEYLAAATRAYREGLRSDETMKAPVAGLGDDIIRDISAFYANQQPQQPNVRKPLTTEEWAQRCDRCHGVNGNSTNPRFPALAAQHPEYLEKVLKAYRTRARRSPEMAAMSDGLSDEDIKNLAAHYARQKARAVVFVPLPTR